MVEYLIVAAIGAGLATAAILCNFKVQTTESWEAQQAMEKGLSTCCTKLVAENAQLRVSLAAGEMSEESKKVAAMTMAALGVVMTNNSGEPETEEMVRVVSAFNQCGDAGGDGLSS